MRFEPRVVLSSSTWCCCGSGVGVKGAKGHWTGPGGRRFGELEGYGWGCVGIACCKDMQSAALGGVRSCWAPAEARVRIPARFVLGILNPHTVALSLVFGTGRSKQASGHGASCTFPNATRTAVLQPLRFLADARRTLHSHPAKHMPPWHVAPMQRSFSLSPHQCNIVQLSNSFPRVPPTRTVSVVLDVTKGVPSTQPPPPPLDEDTPLPPLAHLNGDYARR